jgi:formylmethanofuran dehydrogenase subunit A
VVQYIKKSEYETAQFDDEWIVLNTDQYTITKLNDTGGYCWSLLSEGQTVESLYEAILHKFGSDSAESIKEDIQCFLLELHGYGLIEANG